MLIFYLCASILPILCATVDQNKVRETCVNDQIMAASEASELQIGGLIHIGEPEQDAIFVGDDLNLHPNARDVISKLEGPIYAIGCRGKTRGGKSFVSSRLGRYFGLHHEAFRSANSMESVTRGINYVIIPHPKGGNILLFDSEGQDSFSRECDPRFGLVLSMCVQQMVVVDGSGAFLTSITEDISQMLFHVKKIKNGDLDLDTLHIVLNRYSGEENREFFEMQLERNPRYLQDQRAELEASFKDADHRQLYFLPQMNIPDSDFDGHLHILADAILQSAKPFGQAFNGEMFVQYVELSLKQVQENAESINFGEILSTVYKEYARDASAKILETIEDRLPHYVNDSELALKQSAVRSKHQEYVDSIEERLREHPVIQEVGEALRQSLEEIANQLKDRNGYFFLEETNRLKDIVNRLFQQYVNETELTGYVESGVPSYSTILLSFNQEVCEFHVDTSDSYADLESKLTSRKTSVEIENARRGREIKKTETEKETRPTRTETVEWKGKRRHGVGRRKKYTKDVTHYETRTRTKTTLHNGAISYSAWEVVHQFTKDGATSRIKTPFW